MPNLHNSVVHEVTWRSVDREVITDTRKKIELGREEQLKSLGIVKGFNHGHGGMLYDQGLVRYGVVC